MQKGRTPQTTPNATCPQGWLSLPLPSGARSLGGDLGLWRTHLEDRGLRCVAPGVIINPGPGRRRRREGKQAWRCSLAVPAAGSRPLRPPRPPPAPPPSTRPPRLHPRRRCCRLAPLPRARLGDRGSRTPAPHPSPGTRGGPGFRDPPSPRGSSTRDTLMVPGLQAEGGLVCEAGG